jgi:glycerol-3-phosphate acyltransferase PlsY
VIAATALPATGVFVIPIAIGSFLVGSIPFGLVIGRLFYRTDIRKSGSGNIGAMNALRTLGKKGAIAVLLLDAAKGVIPVIVVTGTLHSHLLESTAALFAVLGHCFSPWLGWRGGKGVATSFGAIFALSWPAGAVCICAWIAGALLVTRFSSVGSMFANVIAPIALYYFTRSPSETLYGIIVAILIIWTHRENIARLRSGTENPIRLFKTTTPTS